MWSRGDKAEYDIWGSIVNDSRWGYDGQLPYMKKTEAFWNASINQDQHGLDGNVFIQSGSSIDREFPLRNYTLESWEALGVDALPFLDANAGNWPIYSPPLFCSRALPSSTLISVDR